VVWTFPDPVPLHREPLYTNRRDLVDKYPTYEDRKYLLPAADPLCVDPEDRLLQGLPDHPDLGRLVEYEGGGDETRSNPWLAELQQDMFVEINPRDANNLGIRDGDMVWVEGPEGGKVKVKAMVTERVGQALPSCRSTSAVTSRAKTCVDIYPRGRPLCARRSDCNTASNLRLRLGHPDAGDQSQLSARSPVCAA
jgi:formate dehydrogenase major subunit